MEEIAYTNGYIGIINEKGFRELKHRFIWRMHNGEIPLGSFIHHIDGDKSNNNIDNLVCVSREEHGILHRRNI